MHLNTQIDDHLWQEAVRLSAQKTPQTLLAEALREYIQRRQARDKTPAALPEEKTRLIEKHGLLFAEGELAGDISQAVREDREARLAVLLERCLP